MAFRAGRLVVQRRGWRMARWRCMPSASGCEALPGLELHVGLLAGGAAARLAQGALALHALSLRVRGSTSTPGLSKLRGLLTGDAAARLVQHAPVLRCGRAEV